MAARRLSRSPGASAAMICTLALGIAAATVTFGIVNAVVLRPLPFPGSTVPRRASVPTLGRRRSETDVLDRVSGAADAPKSRLCSLFPVVPHLARTLD
jgi:hypothetical protein